MISMVEVVLIPMSAAKAVRRLIQALCMLSSVAGLGVCSTRDVSDYECLSLVVPDAESELPRGELLDAVT